MDRRQRKTREAIFAALIALLSQKDFAQITVGEIIDRADVGRATFYAHFDSKDLLLRELCQELFCHLFDAMEDVDPGHKHLFECDAPDSVFLHLFQHLHRNDNNILKLLVCQNNALFSRYFKDYFQKLVISQQSLFRTGKREELPDDFWINHITVTFVETVRWWVDNGMKESPETITKYFLLAV